MHVVIVSGIPGVGKTTVINSFMKLCQEDEILKNVKVKVVNFGDYMLSEALSKGFVKHRDEIRKLNIDQQKVLQIHAAQKIIDDAKKELGENDILIVDTHTLIHTTIGFWPGLPKYVVEVLNPKLIVLVEAKVEDIISRRLRDKSRIRTDEKDIAEIREFLEFARMAAISSAVVSGASFKIILNPEGSPDIAAREMLILIRNLVSRGKG